MPKLLCNLISLNPIAIAVVSLLALLLGASIPIYVDFMVGKISNIFIPPIIFIFLILLVTDRKIIIYAVIIFRSAGDVFLETTKTSIGSITIGIGAIINLIVLLIAFLLIVERPALFPKKLAWPWFPFMLIALFGVINSPVKIDAFRSYTTLLSYFAIFIIAFYLVRTQQDFNKLLRLVVWSSLLPVLYGLGDFLLNKGNENFRLQSTFSHPNIFAFYLVLVMSLSLYLIKTRLFPLGIFGKISVTCNLLLMFCMLLLTQTRSAWIAFFVIFFMYALLFEKRYLLYVLLIPIVVFLMPSLRDRLANLDSSNEVYQYAELNSFSWRLSLWRSALEWMETSKYIAGYGLESFKFHSKTFFLKSGVTNWGAHNVYIQLIFEAGILGLLSFLSLFYNMANYLKKLYRTERLGLFFMLALLCEYLVVAFSDNTLAYLVFNWYFWLSIGAGCSLVLRQTEKRNA